MKFLRKAVFIHKRIKCKSVQSCLFVLLTLERSLVRTEPCEKAFVLSLSHEVWGLFVVLSEEDDRYF